MSTTKVSRKKTKGGEKESGGKNSGGKRSVSKGSRSKKSGGKGSRSKNSGGKRSGGKRPGGKKSSTKMDNAKGNKKSPRISLLQKPQVIINLIGKKKKIVYPVFLRLATICYYQKDMEWVRNFVSYATGSMHKNKYNGHVLTCSSKKISHKFTLPEESTDDELYDLIDDLKRFFSEKLNIRSKKDRDKSRVKVLGKYAEIPKEKLNDFSKLNKLEPDIIIHQFCRDMQAKYKRDYDYFRKLYLHINLSLNTGKINKNTDVEYKNGVIQSISGLTFEESGEFSIDRESKIKNEDNRNKKNRDYYLEQWEKMVGYMVEKKQSITVRSTAVEDEEEEEIEVDIVDEEEGSSDHEIDIEIEESD